MKQKSLASVAYDSKKKQTRREKFLETMEAVIPWERLIRVIERHYPKAGNGRQPMGLEKMLQIHYLHWLTCTLVRKKLLHCQG